MTDQIRQERCEEIRGAMIELIPAIIEGSGQRTERLLDAKAPLARLQAVAARGAEGIDNPDYAAWTELAQHGLKLVAEALDAQDGDAAFAALRGPESGLDRLNLGCADCAGW